MQPTIWLFVQAGHSATVLKPVPMPTLISFKKVEYYSAGSNMLHRGGSSVLRIRYRFGQGPDPDAASQHRRDPDPA